MSKKHAPGTCDGLTVRCARLSVNDTAEGWVKDIDTEDGFRFGCSIGVCGGPSCMGIEYGFWRGGVDVERVGTENASRETGFSVGAPPWRAEVEGREMAMENLGLPNDVFEVLLKLSRIRSREFSIASKEFSITAVALSVSSGLRENDRQGTHALGGACSRRTR